MILTWHPNIELTAIEVRVDEIAALNMALSIGVQVAPAMNRFPPPMFSVGTS